MWKLLQYYGKYQGFRGSLGGMPGWARFVLFLVALPGIAAIFLSILALLVSILALLLLTVPVFRLLSWITGMSSQQAERDSEFEVDLSGGADEFIDPSEDVSPSSEVSGGELMTYPESSSSQVTMKSGSPDRPRRQIDVKIIE